MENLSPAAIGELLQPYLASPAPSELCEQVSRYLTLLEHWGRKVSLTSVREPVQIVQRHFGESLFLVRHLPPATTLLDFGSGAGFPGVPAALLRPDLQVTLAESQGRKAAFLREVVAELNLRATVWADRVEKMPPSSGFDVVALRAVDRMESALRLASEKVGPVGTFVFLAGESTPETVLKDSWKAQEIPVPCSSGRLVLATRSN